MGSSCDSLPELGFKRSVGARSEDPWRSSTDKEALCRAWRKDPWRTAAAAGQLLLLLLQGRHHPCPWRLEVLQVESLHRQGSMASFRSSEQASMADSIVSTFQWRRSSTFASSYLFLSSSIIAYLLATVSLSLLLSRSRSPIPLGPLPALHNLALFLASLIMFLGSFTSSSSESSSWKWFFCFPPGTPPSGPVFFWSYAFYLSKYYELLDTLILLLKRRPLTFLHVFHHAVVIVMSFFWLESTQSLQVIALLTNTSVHMLMYSYYFLCSLGFRPPWKKLVTNCQIVQFVFSFAVSLVLLWLHFEGDGCAGMGGWTFNAFFNASLLLLFLNFHRQQYRVTGVKKRIFKGKLQD